MKRQTGERTVEIDKKLIAVAKIELLLVRMVCAFLI